MCGKLFSLTNFTLTIFQLGLFTKLFSRFCQKQESHEKRVEQTVLLDKVSKKMSRQITFYLELQQENPEPLLKSFSNNLLSICLASQIQVKTDFKFLNFEKLIKNFLGIARYSLLCLYLSQSFFKRR